MNRDKKRRLAAILFADIVGYTSMMQRNEQEGLAKVQRFKEVLQQEVSEHDGEILQFMGDGCLCIFQSAVQSLRAAKAIQLDLQSWPEVPLRIGIHLGDIVIQEDSVYGDGVNIASRIESMGVSGAVLVSSSIRQQIKNKPEFELAALGKFSFKNVAEPMTVYALANEGFAVPKPGEMKGKGEKVAEKKTATQPWIRFASIGFVAMAVGAVLFWALGSGTEGKSQLLDKDIREAKVGVNVFDNFTGDESLDALGYMASEWISSGLREVKVRTVSAEMVRQNKDKVGILPNNPEGKPSFAEITGAQYVVTGSYFLKNDSIVLNTRLSSTETGEGLYNFPKLTGHKDQKEKLVEEAQAYLLGYWVLEQDQRITLINPPKYEAYQAYLKCRGTQTGCYQAVLDIDPDFLLARILQTGSCAMRGEEAIFSANKIFIEQRWDQCTAYEKLWFRAMTSTWEGNYRESLEAQEAIYQLDSNDYLSLHQAGFSALVLSNMPHRAIEKFDRLFAKIELFEDQILGWSYYHYLDALNRAGEYQKAADFYLALSENAKGQAWDRSAHYTMGALLYQDRISETLDLLHQRGDKKEDYIRAAFMYKLIHADSPENPFANQLKAQIDQFDDKLALDWEGVRLFDWKTKASIYYILGEWDKAEEALLKMQNPKELRRIEAYSSFPEQVFWEKLWHTAMLGCVYARQGNTAKSEAQIEQIDSLSRLYPINYAVFHRGSYPYLKARIYAEMGQQERAIAFLQESVRQGRPFGYMSFTMDMFLVNLKGYPPFEELIRPKG